MRYARSVRQSVQHHNHRGTSVTRARRRARITTRRAVLATAIVALSVVPAAAQLRIVTYNTANADPAHVAPRDGMDSILAAIGDESVGGIAKPVDVLALQEQTNSNTTTQSLVDMLNGIYGAGTYDRATRDGDSWGAGRPGLVFNTQSVTLVDQRAFGHLSSSGPVRQTLRYQLRPVGYDSSADFYVYVDHYKASSLTSPEEVNRARRNIEAMTLRADADALGQGTHVIYAGDYNIQSSDEPSYQTLLAAGNGQAFDPIHRPGVWRNNNALKFTHTQAPAWSPPSGLTGGGMDDRFDFQLVTGEMLDGEGLSYIPGSYHAFGNNGTHACCNSSITTGTGAAPEVLTALTAVSDHIPVVADYQVPAMMAASVAPVPSRIVVGANVDVQVSVENIAPVVTAKGADELDYHVTGVGAVGGSATGTASALSGAHLHTLALDASTAGFPSGQVRVESTSPGVANGHCSATVSATVVHHAAASLDSQAPNELLVLDFGDVPVGGGQQHLSADLWNLDLTGEPTAALDVDWITGIGSTDVLTTDLAPFSGLNAGDRWSFDVLLDTSVAGSYIAIYTIDVSDEDLPGATASSSLHLMLSGSVFLPGDMDGNGIVDFDDIGAFVLGLNAPAAYTDQFGLAPAVRGDLDGDGDQDFDDIEGFATILAGGGTGVRGVPEPAAFWLLVLGALSVLGARGRPDRGQPFTFSGKHDHEHGDKSS